MAEHTLFYDKPANLWDDATPIGNGRLGAMVRGTTDVERLWINEDSVWYGGPQNRLNPAARDALPKVRELIDQNRIREAEQLIKKTQTARPRSLRHYEPLGDVFLTFGHGQDPPGDEVRVSGIVNFENSFSRDLNRSPQNYRRELDLRTGISSVSYDFGGAHYERQVFSSTVDEVIATSVRSEGEYSFQIDLNRGDHPEWDRRLNQRYDSLEEIDGGHMITGSMGSKGAVEFAMGVRVIADPGDGEVQVDNTGYNVVVNAKGRVIVLVSGETTFRNPNAGEAVQNRLATASMKSWNDLKSAHVERFSALYDRVELQLPGSGDKTAIPIDQRIQAVKQGAVDNGLAQLLFHYGRYLLISCSLSGLPANLQGIWNRDHMPVWGSKYTININIQMNYWPAEVTNLAETHDVLFRFLERTAERGAETAKAMYGCRGWLMHHNTDIWADTAPQDDGVQCTYWTLSGAWFMIHLWEHYRFGRDKDFLRRVYPLMAGSALFFQDFLVERDGKLITSPSSSAENSYYILGTKTVASIAAGPAWDGQILMELFRAVVEAGKLLGEDTAEFEEVLAKLPTPQIGKHGQVMEWKDDVEEAEPGHRHISHLWGLFPGNTLNTPKLHDAAKVTLQRRLAGGGGHTSWSLAWILCQYARLRDVEGAHAGIQKMIGGLLLNSMLTSHPPFQIDGNFGFAAAVAEMLLQSQVDDETDSGNTIIDLIPTLLPAWERRGSVRGLRARGAVDIQMLCWEDGKLLEAVAVSKATEPQTRVFRVAPNRLKQGSKSGGRISVDLVPGKAVTLPF
ncbi:Alpha-L-fucosidase 2 [Colletotrichum siamense]|nr:Alpha-L-fucosidase 2 [Colletotrichum siamense]